MNELNERILLLFHKSLTHDRKYYTRNLYLKKHTKQRYKEREKRKGEKQVQPIHFTKKEKEADHINI